MRVTKERVRENYFFLKVCFRSMGKWFRILRNVSIYQPGSIIIIWPQNCNTTLLWSMKQMIKVHNARWNKVVCNINYSKIEDNKFWHYSILTVRRKKIPYLYCKWFSVSGLYLSQTYYANYITFIQYESKLNYPINDLKRKELR